MQPAHGADALREGLVFLGKVIRDASFGIVTRIVGHAQPAAIVGMTNRFNEEDCWDVEPCNMEVAHGLVLPSAKAARCEGPSPLRSASGHAGAFRLPNGGSQEEDPVQSKSGCPRCRRQRAILGRFHLSPSWN